MPGTRLLSKTWRQTAGTILCSMVKLFQIDTALK